MFRKASFLTTIAVAAYGQAASASTLYSFEDLAPGVMVNGNGVIVDTGNGITDGTKALRLANSTGAFDKLGHIIVNDFVSPGVTISDFTVDWYFEAGPGSAGSWNGLTLGMYNQATFSWLQLGSGPSDTTTIGEYIGQDAAANGQYTVQYNLGPNDMAFINNAITNGQPLEMGFYSNKDAGSGVNGTYTVDNIQFNVNVPPTILESWEDEALGEPNGTGSVINTSPGITDGSQALRADLVAGNSYQLIGEVNLTSPSTDSYDTIIADWYHQFTGTNTDYLELVAGVFLPNTSEFDQFAGAKTVGNPDAFVGSSDGQFTIVYDLDATEKALLNGALAAGDPVVLQFYANKHTDRLGTLTLDNIRAVLGDTPVLLGDLDGDGFVGIADLNIVLGNWNQNVTAGDPSVGDPSGDGFVGIEDLNTVLGNWNAGTPPTANAVPEPASLALFGFSAMVTLRRRH